MSSEARNFRQDFQHADPQKESKELEEKIEQLPLLAYKKRLQAFSEKADFRYVIEDTIEEDKNASLFFDAFRYGIAVEELVRYFEQVLAPLEASFKRRTPAQARALAEGRDEIREKKKIGERQIKKILALCLSKLDTGKFKIKYLESRATLPWQNIYYRNAVEKMLETNLDMESQAEEVCTLLKSFRKEEISSFLAEIFSAINRDQNMEAVCAWPEEKDEDLMEDVLTSIKKLGSEEKIKALISLARAKQSDFFFSHYEELQLTDEQTNKLFIIIAQEDPEGLLHNLAYIDLDSFDREEILATLFEVKPVAFLAYSQELKLASQEQITYLTELSTHQPFDFIKHYKELAVYIKINVSKLIPVWEKNILVELENKKLSAVEVINNFFGIDIVLLPQVNEYVQDKLGASITEIGELLVGDIKNNVGKYSAALCRDQAIVFLKNLGIKNEFNAILFFVSYVLNASDDDKEEWYDYAKALEKDGNGSYLKITPAVQAPIFEWYVKNKKNPEFVNVYLLPESEFCPKTKEEIQIALEFIEQELNEQDPSVPEFLKLINVLPISEKEKEGKIIELIMKKPVEFVEMYSRSSFKMLSQNLRERIIFLLLQEDPIYLANLYNKIVLEDKKKEQQIFQELMDKGVEPFSQFKKVSELLPLLRNERFEWLWYKNAEAEQARLVIMEAREKMSEKAWTLLLSTPDIGKICLKWKVENYLVFEKVFANRESALSKFIIENNLAVLVMLSMQGLPRCEEILKQIEEYNKEKKREHQLKNRDKSKAGSHYSQPSAGENGRVFTVCYLLNTSPENANKAIKNIESASYGLSYNIFRYITKAEQLQFLLGNIDRLKNLVDKKSVTSNVAIIEIILESDDPKEKLIFFEKYADMLDSADPIWGQLVKLSSEVLLRSQESFVATKLQGLCLPLSENSYIWEGIPLEQKQVIIAASVWERGFYQAKMSDLSIEQFEIFLTNRLRQGLDLSAADMERASLRNTEFANSVNDRLVFPYGTLTHFSNLDAAEGILETGNFCGECLGMDTKEDSFPYHVDTIRLDETVLDKSVQAVLADKRTNYGPQLMFFYPHRLESNYHQGEEYKVDSRHFNHYLIFGLLPKDELGGIVVQDKEKNKAYTEKEDSLEEKVEKIKIAIVKNDVYVPVFDAQGVLLFSVNEFEERWHAEKPYASLSQLLASEDYFAGLDVAQGGGHKFTLKEHSLRVQSAVESYLEGIDLSQDEKELSLVAARLHDIGKLEEKSIQEIANVDKAREILNKVKYLGVEKKRVILKLIRNDELLGEILKGITVGQDGFVVSKETKAKLAKFNDIFIDPKERIMIRAIYESDVRSIGGNEYEDWQVAEKLMFLFGE